MFQNLRSTTERLVTVFMLLVALIACEQVPEANSESDQNHLAPIESQSTVVPLAENNKIP